MKRLVLSLLCSLALLPSMAQKESAFHGTIENADWSVYITMDLDKCNVVVPQQELFGETCGYLGDWKDPRKWIITSAKIETKHKAQLTIINDYGSEDLTAELVQTNDSTFELRQVDGSRIKVVRNRHFKSLPKTLVFKRLSL